MEAFEKYKESTLPVETRVKLFKEQFNELVYSKQHNQVLKRQEEMGLSNNNKLFHFNKEKDRFSDVIQILKGVEESDLESVASSKLSSISSYTDSDASDEVCFITSKRKLNNSSLNRTTVKAYGKEKNVYSKLGNK